MPLPIPDVAPADEQATRPRTRRLRRRSDRLIRLIAVMGIFGAVVISAVLWHQSVTIEQQRALIQQIYQDDLELKKKQPPQPKKNTTENQLPAGPYADGCMVHSGPCT